MRFARLLSKAPALNHDQKYRRKKSGALRYFTKNTNLFRPPCPGGLWQGPRTGTVSARTGSTTRQTKFILFYISICAPPPHYNEVKGSVSDPDRHLVSWLSLVQIWNALEMCLTEWNVFLLPYRYFIPNAFVPVGTYLGMHQNLLSSQIKTKVRFCEKKKWQKFNIKWMEKK